MKLKTILTLVIFTALFITSCGSNATESDLKKADESAKELESIDYDKVEMPDAGEDTSTETEEEEFDADSMLD